MPVTIDGQTYYRTAEVYRMLGITRNTLYRWLHKGVLGEIEFRDSRGWRLFTRDEIDKLSAAINRITRTNRYVRNKSGSTRKSTKDK